MNKSIRIFFLGGIHGVGKGTFCKNLCTHSNLEHLTASELLRWSEMNEDSFDKKVGDINYTQDRLLIALGERCQKGSTYLLDGHFCLLDKNNEPSKVPERTFVNINPEKLLLLTDSAHSIKQRLEKRDKKFYDISLVENMQATEISYAKYLSELLDTELIIFSNEESGDIIKRLKSII